MSQWPPQPPPGTPPPPPPGPPPPPPPGGQPPGPWGYQQPYQPYQQPYQPYPTYPGYGVVQQNSGKATAAMVIGIVSLVICWGLLSPVALALGLSARKDIDRSGGQLGGRGQATAGWILGLIGTVLLAIFVVIFVIAVIVDSSNNTSNTIVLPWA